MPKVLRERLGEEATDAFIEIVKEIDLDARKDSLSIAEERFEKRLAEEVGKLRTEMYKLKSEMLKWMFIFWASQIGIIFAFLKFMIK